MIIVSLLPAGQMNKAKHNRSPQLFRTLIKVTALCIAGGTLVLLGRIPIKLAIAAHQAPQPEAIFVLGGNPDREEAAAQLAKYYPDLDIWVSSGDLPKAAHKTFEASDITLDRIHLDYRATDTVTNFTTLIDQFKQRDIQHLYLVTSDFHMPRAKVIATIVLGHHGIAFTPISVPSNELEESWLRIARDGGRSILWIMTGYTGASFAERVLVFVER